MHKLEEQFIRNSKMGRLNLNSTVLTSSTIDNVNFNMLLSFDTAHDEVPIEEDKSYTIDDALVAAGGFGKWLSQNNIIIR